MKEAREFEAATEEEAVRAAARELGVNEQDLEYELAEPPSKGILGMGTRPARIVVMVEASEEPVSGGEDVGEPSLERDVLDFQSRIIRAMQLELKAEAESTEEHLKIELVGPDRDIVLQSRAELLEAFQYLLNRTFSRSLGGLRILVDCDGFRRKKEEELKQIAQRISERVRMTGKSEELGMMNPYERRIVHLTVADEEGVTSESAGNGFLKRVVIFPS
jgi:spoIIIJ-associated protein